MKLRMVYNMGIMNMPFFAVGIEALAIGFILVLMGYGAQRLVADTKLFRFSCSVGALALILGVLTATFAGLSH